MSVFDQRGDILGTVRHEIEKLVDLPACVKQASVEALCGTASMPPSAFADPEGRRFPIHTKAATILSAAYFARTGDGLPAADAAAVVDGLAEAVRYWNVGDEAAEAMTSKQASEARVDYLFPESREGRLADPAEVGAAAAWLVKYQDDYTRDERESLASRVLSKAAALAVPLGDAEEPLRRMAAQGLCATSHLLDEIEKRAALCTKDADRADLHKLAAAIGANPDSLDDGDLSAEVVDMLESFDTGRGLDRLYGSRLSRPGDVVYGLTAKVAADFDSSHVRLVNGSIYALDDVARLDRHALAEQIGDDVAFDMAGPGGGLDRTKAAEMLPILPRDDAARFDRLAAACGISARVKAAEAGSGFSDAALEALAAD